MDLTYTSFNVDGSEDATIRLVQESEGEGAARLSIEAGGLEVSCSVTASGAARLARALHLFALRSLETANDQPEAKPTLN